MPKVFIGVGSNLGDRARMLQLAWDFLGSVRGVRMIKSSSVRETDPVGGPSGQGKYLNAVWQIETELAPQVLLRQLLAIEKELGRVRSRKNGPRPIDLDILFYDQAIIRKRDLTVPHPRLHERAFALEPMVELEPAWVHPELFKTMKQLLEALGRPYGVRRKAYGEKATPYSARRTQNS